MFVPGVTVADCFPPDGIVSPSGIRRFRLKAVNSGSNLVSFMLIAEKAGNCVFNLYNINGGKVTVRQISLGSGSYTIHMDNRPLKSGMYILTGD